MPVNQKKRFKPPSLLEFQARFPSDKECLTFLYAKRWPNGWKCPRCGHSKCYVIASRRLYECAACGYQASITAGTVLHKTRTALRLWFIAIFLVVTDKRGISSVALGKQLGITQKKAWYMLHKIRHAMGERDGRYVLDGLVELDESVFGPPKDGGQKAPAAVKAKTLVGLSLTPHGHPRYIRFAVLPGFGRAHLDKTIDQMVAKGAAVRTDGLRSYLCLAAKGFRHEGYSAGKAGQIVKPRWLRVVVSNTRANIGGTYHGLGEKHLQSYLNEQSYRFNRRRRPDTIFDRCVTAVMTCHVWTYRQITGTEQAVRKPKHKVG